MASEYNVLTGRFTERRQAESAGGATAEVKATVFLHRGCGGTVLASLDGESCAQCGAELQEDDWFTPGEQPQQIPGRVPDDLDVDVRAWPS